MINNVYQTTALSVFDVKKIQENIEKVFMTQRDEEEIRLLKTFEDSDYKVYELLPTNTTVELFSLPMVFRTNPTQKEPLDIIIDVRPFTRQNKQQEVVINNLSEYKFAVNTAMITRKWMDDDFVNVDEEFLLKVWSRWIGTALISKLNIEQTMQPPVIIITAYYLYCMLNQIDTPISNPIDLKRTAGVISRATFTQQITVTELLEQLDYPVNNIGTYIQALKEYTGSIRFDKITPGFIYALIQFGWYGNGVTRICGAAVEFPPVFVAMVYSAIVQDGYNKTAIGRIIKDLDKNSRDEFVKQVERNLATHR